MNTRFAYSPKKFLLKQKTSFPVSTSFYFWRGGGGPFFKNKNFWRVKKKKK